MLDSKLGCALIGYGYWGPRLARNIHAVPNADLLHICDLEPANISRARNDFPTARSTADWPSILADSRVDAVIVATPIKTHAALASQALDAGKHVFVEKPLGHTSAAARELVIKAASKSLILMSGHTYLYSPAIRQVKKLIDSGSLGKIVHVSSSRLNYGRLLEEMSVVWDLMPHDISILRYLFSDRFPRRVEAAGVSHLRQGITDTAHALMYYDGGLTAELRASWIYPQKTRLMHVIGTRKFLIFDDTQPLEKIQIIDRSLEADHLGLTNEDNHLSAIGNDIGVPSPDETEPLFAEISEFASCALEGYAPLSDGYLGLEVVEILEMIDARVKNDSSNGSTMMPLISEALAVAGS